MKSLPGELTLLVGPSGCGKTTLISILAGTLEPTSGEVVGVGRRPGRLSKREKGRFRAQNVGFVFQQFNLLPSLTAAENVAVPLVINGSSKAHGRGACERSSAIRWGWANRAGSLPSQLSGGQQQRVAIARALVHKPRLLVCDEPTSAIDARTGHAIMTLIREVALQPDRVTVVVTHDQRVYDFADRIVTLEDGRVASGPVGRSQIQTPRQVDVWEHTLKESDDVSSMDFADDCRRAARFWVCTRDLRPEAETGIAAPRAAADNSVRRYGCRTRDGRA